MADQGHPRTALRLAFGVNLKIESGSCAARNDPPPACGRSVTEVALRIAVPREGYPGERRVALVPESCRKLIQAGYEISIESGCGDATGFADAAYREVGVGTAAF